VHEFIAALRQLQRPLVLLAVVILLLQSLVAGLANGHIAGQIATFGADAVICHATDDDDGSAPAQKAAHDCCTFCTNAGPVVLSAATPVIAQLAPAHAVARDAPADVRPTRRAIRAGPSQAPPTVA
jgi:hypothetical protein